MKSLTLSFGILAMLAWIGYGDEEKKASPEDLEVLATESGLKYSILTQGKEGPHPALSDMVTIHYTGSLENGSVFVSTLEKKEPTDMKVFRSLPGLSEGFQLMTPGSKYKFIIPPELGFGAQGNPPVIPGNATLIFEVEMFGVKKGPPLPEYHKGNADAQKTSESGLVYEFLQPGIGEPPNANEIVQVKFAFWNEEERLVDCSELDKNYLKYPLGQAGLEFLNEGAGLLTLGARIRFVVPPKLGFGERGMGPLVPPNSSTVWELELVEIIKPLPVPDFSLSLPENLVTTASGLKYEVIKEGDGKSPAMGQDVTVHYAGWLEDGTCFDNSFERAEPSTFKLGRVIPGWNEGLQLMREGDVFKFTIPSDLAYGPRGSPPRIPPNATLIFYVELFKVGMK